MDSPGALLTPRHRILGMVPREFKGCFRVARATRKTFTLYSPGSSGRFSGRRMAKALNARANIFASMAVFLLSALNKPQGHTSN